MLAEISGKSPQPADAMASNIFFRAATTLYPGDAASFKHDLDNAKDGLLDIRRRSDSKAMFYFLRNCRDSSNPTLVEGAVRELLLR